MRDSLVIVKLPVEKRLVREPGWWNTLAKVHVAVICRYVWVITERSTVGVPGLLHRYGQEGGQLDLRKKNGISIVKNLQMEQMPKGLH